MIKRDHIEESIRDEVASNEGAFVTQCKDFNFHPEGVAKLYQGLCERSSCVSYAMSQL